MLLMKDSGDRTLEKSGPRVGRQAVMVEAPHSMAAHIALASAISMVVSIFFNFS